MDHRKKLNGGVLVFTKDEFENHNLLKANTDKSKDLIYENNTSFPQYGVLDRINLQQIVNVIIPNIYYKKKLFGYDFVKNVEYIKNTQTVTTLAYNDLFINVFKDNKNRIDIIERIFRDKNAPTYLNKYHGYILSKGYLENYNYHINNTLIKNKDFSIGHFGSPYPKFYDPELYFLFYDRLDGNMHDYCEKILPKINKDKRLHIAYTFLTQIIEGIRYLHKKGFMHCNITADNILYKFDTDGTLKFKLTNFEWIIDIDKSTGKCTIEDDDIFAIVHYATSPFFKGITSNNVSYLYDIYCIMHILFTLLGVFSTIDESKNIVGLINNIYDILKKHSHKNPINEFITMYDLQKPINQDERDMYEHIMYIASITTLKIDLPFNEW